MTTLRTERLTLRRARWGDLDAIHAALSDPEAMHFWSNAPHSDLEQTRAWLASMIDSSLAESDDFVIETTDGVVGKLGAWRLPEIGFLLRSDQWGRGYATEAMRTFLDHIFQRPDTSHLTADVDPRNGASLRLLERHGFEVTGHASATWDTHIGVCDSVYLRLDRDRWRPAG